MVQLNYNSHGSKKSLIIKNFKFSITNDGFFMYSFTTLKKLKVCWGYIDLDKY